MANSPAQQNSPSFGQRSAAPDAADKKNLSGQSSYSTNRPNTEKKLNTSDDLDEDEEDEDENI